MYIEFNDNLLQILDANELIILLIIKQFKSINKVQILDIFSKITPNKLDKVIRVLIKKKLIYYGKNYTLKIYSGDVLEHFPYKYGTLPLQISPTMNVDNFENNLKNKNLSIYKDNIKNKNKNKNKKEEEKENNIKNIIKEKENLITKKISNLAPQKIGYKVYDLDVLLKIINPSIPREYVANLFEHFESQNFKSSGTLVTNLKTRIELYYKKNYYQNFNKKNEQPNDFEQKLRNIENRNEQLRGYELAKKNGN